MMQVEGITPRVQEIGRIRMGEKGPKGAPVSLKTFRLTSSDRAVLEAAAKLYGGKVTSWDDAPDAGMWQLTTAAAELDILIPRALRSLSQKWELWQGGTCERRCDGRTEEIGKTPCLCGDDRGEDGFCEIMTRLSIILPRLPGLGLWRLDTGGWHAASTLGPTVELLLALDPRSMVPAVLRAVPGSSKVRGVDPKDGQVKVTTHRFIRPMVDAPGITIGQLVAGDEREPPLLEAGPAPRPQTAEERVARQRAAVEERQAAAAQIPSPADVLASAVDAEIVEGEVVETVQSQAAERVAEHRAERLADVPTLTLSEFMLLKGEKGVQFGPDFTAAVEALTPGVPWAKYSDTQRHALAVVLGMIAAD